MPESETSSENREEQQEVLENGNKKHISSDTDYYMSNLANPLKIAKPTVESESSDLNIIHDSESSDSDNSSDSKTKYDKITIPSKRSPNNRLSDIEENSEKRDNVTFAPPSNNYSNNYSNSIEPTQNNDIKPLSPQEIRMKKIEFLRKLSEIKSKGFNLSKEYDFNSSLEEMEYEYSLLKSFVDKRNGIKVFKGGLLQVASVVEFLNDKYDPFDFHLSGWSEHLSVESDNWEDVFEELYEKYKGSGKKMAPEIKLVYLIIVSASAFHFTKVNSASMPGLDSVLASNPGLLSKLINPGKGESSNFMTSQEMHLEKQKMELKRKELEDKARLQQQKDFAYQNQIRLLQEQLRNQQSQSQEPQPSNTKGLPPTISANQLKPTMTDIRAPNQVKDILNRIHNIQGNKLKSQSNTEDETSSNDRLVSEEIISETSGKKKQVKRSTKKPNVIVL